MNLQLKNLGSYNESDVTFLLKDLSHLTIEQDNEIREKLKEQGVHYSEMLPVEYKPKPEYMKTYYDFLDKFGSSMALYTGVMAERILKDKGNNVVLVSLARAGTPIGVLAKRYIKNFKGLDLPHYSISIIRDRGIDYNAIKYIVKNHPDSRIQFIDGWTGKGAITKELKKSAQVLKEDYGIEIDYDLAVVADPGHCAEIYGTREDLLIPSSCLNSTVSGLMSRTIYSEDWIGKNDFHGAKYYAHLEEEDVSLDYIEKIESLFEQVRNEVSSIAKEVYNNELIWKGQEFVLSIMNEYGIDDINKVKPGVGETTRVLLRRVPWKILIKDMEDIQIRHILLLAKDLNVPIEVKPEMTYACCGIIKGAI